ncbi:hypothetical protein [Rugamonas apoptosis]|uniref:Uncharacterized protein n=1 Tax=Rugamonas apoptosis TaxID=2758570 RepID=A0A7W2FBW3_9BURK|nr:hypothetical protein [Rugamonas apoptosis]MBA5688870.1 hypothetical protein [Rugamonas apoptosis]
MAALAGATAFPGGTATAGRRLPVTGIPHGAPVFSTLAAKQVFTKRFSQISTSTVDNVVGNRHLTARQASIGAGFNKMPIPQAEKIINKINSLRFVKLGRTASFQVVSKYF